MGFNINVDILFRQIWPKRNIREEEMKILLSILFNVTILMLASATIDIPSDYSTIQAGINAATSGDTVLVQPGTYREGIDYNGKRITVRPAPNEWTILNESHPVLVN